MPGKPKARKPSKRDILEPSDDEERAEDQPALCHPPFRERTPTSSGSEGGLYSPPTFHMESTWIPHGMRMDSIWIPHGLHMDSTWTPSIPYRLHVDSIHSI